jgi:hypothetical protein
VAELVEGHVCGRTRRVDDAARFQPLLQLASKRRVGNVPLAIGVAGQPREQPPTPVGEPAANLALLALNQLDDVLVHHGKRHLAVQLVVAYTSVCWPVLSCLKGSNGRLSTSPMRSPHLMPMTTMAITLRGSRARLSSSSIWRITRSSTGRGSPSGAVGASPRAIDAVAGRRGDQPLSR